MVIIHVALYKTPFTTIRTTQDFWALLPGGCPYIMYKHGHSLKGASYLKQPSAHDPGSGKDLMAYIYAFLSEAGNMYLN